VPVPSPVRAFVSGVLVANSVPHIASGVAGRRHLTPLQGRTSGPAANLAWGIGNAVAGYAMLRIGRTTEGRAWDVSLVAFEAGTAVWAVWCVISERLLRINHRLDDPR
jgi:hypothetical protein